MADINRDLDRYLRKRQSERSGDGPSFFDKMFSGAKHSERLSPDEEDEIEMVEHELKQGEREIETVHELEHELEERQERKVGLYHRLLRWFSRGPEREEHIELPARAPPAEDEHAAHDVRTLSEISMRWLGRLPTRIRDEFKASEDYTVFTGILERRGIAKKK
jgi:hypothetical protein